MTKNRQSPDPNLLSLCAILRWFNGEMLQALTECDHYEIEILLGSDLVQAVPELPGMYQLREDIKVETLARLRAERISDELTLHGRIFVHFVEKILESAPGASLAEYVDRCLYHLGEVFLLIAPREEWHILTNLVAFAQAVTSDQPRMRRWLAFYEGFAAIRTHNYERGETLLTTLLDQVEQEEDLRLRILNALGNAYWSRSDYGHAIERYQQALALTQASNDRFYQAVTLANMSTIYSEIADYQQALNLMTQSLALFQELHDPYREARALYHIGLYAIYLGSWSTAQANFDNAIALYQALGIPTAQAHLYWGRGFLYHMLGDAAQSETEYLHALEILQSQEYDQPELSVDIHFQLGFLYQVQSRWEEALSEYDCALELAHQLHNEYSATFIHYRRGNVFERQGRHEQALEAYHAAIEGIEAMRGDIKAEEIKIGLFGTTQQVYESMILLLLKLDRQAEAFEYVERARSRAFLDLLTDKPAMSGAEGSPEVFAAIEQPVATLAEVQRRLPPDALLVEYFTIGVLPRGESLINMLPQENTRLREHLALPPQVLIFAVTHDRLAIFHPELDPNSLRPQPRDPGPGKRMLRERLLTRLHAQLIAPLAELLAGRRLLYMIPHGPLHYVPFMALRSEAGAYLLAADGPAIALAPSATILLRNCLGRSHAMAQHRAPLLALGYNDEGADALRYAEPEARHIATMLGGQAWTGPESKSAQLCGAASRVRWLHIAGHAYYDPHDPLGSALKLGADDMFSARQIIEKLDLKADLVTLSACLSGVTQVVPGDEMLGLQRAFLYAGAPAVVCTLWETADLVALLVMDHFYADMRRGVAPALALRDAQVAVRDMTGRDLLATIARWRYEDAEFAAAITDLPVIPPERLDARIYADPAYWAAFMLIGRAD